MKKFPKVLYVHEEGEDEDAFFVANRDLMDAIEDDGPTDVATYELVKTAWLKKTVCGA